MTHMLVAAGKALAAAGFAAMLVLFAWFGFPRFAARVRGSARIYARSVRSRMWAGRRGTVRMERSGI